MPTSPQSRLPNFHRCLETLANEGGVAFFLGRSDVGKSTRIGDLVERLTAKGGSVAVIDADLGQSTYGLPTTLNLVRFTANAEGLTPEVIATFFVGAISPVGHLLQTLVGCRRLLDLALELGVRTILIDTTGLVDGTLAVEFKLQKIEVLHPTHVLALAQGNELNPILNACRQRQDMTICRVPIAAAVRERSAEERRANRQERYRRYFAGALRHRFSLDAVEAWGRFPNLDRTDLQGLLVGLNDGYGLCQGVGRLHRVTRSEVEVWTPLQTVAAVKLLRFGSVAVETQGKERLFSPREW
jgi:polynucleotide 5'-hydroxyl-kinase GRC3/NOL9